MIPILYEPTETAFISNGVCRLRDCISCIVYEERNGIYELDFEYPVGGANFDQIQCGRIIAVRHDDTNDVQPFDIVSYTKPINGIVSFHAVHISYRLRGYVVEEENVNTLSTALTKLTMSTPANGFTFQADFTASGYAGAFNGLPRTVRQLLGGVEGSILDTYGGEYEWDKFNVILHRSRGVVADFKIRYGLNMVDYNEDIDYSETYTSAVPYWVGDDGNGGETVVKGNKVDSGYVPYNTFEKCVPLDLSDKFETAPTSAELETLAYSKMTSQNVNLPKQSIQVDFIRLNDFDEYNAYAPLLQCKLCDSIEVIFPDYQTSGLFKIVRTEYDVLRERFNNMELGTLSTTLAQALGVGEESSTIGGGGGGGSRTYYGTCTTAGATAAKTVDVDGSFALVTGAKLTVKFTNANSVANPTLNVNSLGAKPIMRYGTTTASTSSASSWNSGSTVQLTYDGTNFIIDNFNNTTYSGMSDAEYQSGTSTTDRLITPARLVNAIKYWAVALADKYTRSSTGDLAWTNQTDGDAKVIAKSALAFWNGAYAGSGSNLSKCSTGNIIGSNGGTMTGQLKTSFKTSVAMGSYGTAQTTVPNLVAEVRFSSGCMGSASINTAYTNGTVTIPTGWYNFIYTPHRSGGNSGSADGDNCNYGNLLLFSMTMGGGRYVIRVTGGSISEVVQILDSGSGIGKTTWTPTSGSSYANYGGCYYEKYGRVVHVHVGVSGLTSNTATVIYTLPSGYRPSSPIYAHGTGGSATIIGYLEIGTDGKVQVRSNGSTYVGADATFLA